MLGLVDYGSTDEEEEKEIKLPEKEAKPKIVSVQIQEKTSKEKKKKKRKFSKAEIFQRLGVGNNEDDESEDIEEDLSYQVSKKQKQEPETITKKLEFNRNLNFAPSNNYDTIEPASSKNSLDFMNKVTKIISGEQKISDVSPMTDFKIQRTSIPKQVNPFIEKKKTLKDDYNDEDFIFDPNEYNEEEQIEEVLEEPQEVSSEKEIEEVDAETDSFDDLNIPKDVLSKLKSDSSFIEIANSKKMREEREAMRRREMIEKHKMSIYETKIPVGTLSNPGKSKSSLSFLASESKRTEYERAMKREEAAKNQKKSRSKYGW